MNIKINPEYAKLVPPLSSGEYQELNQSIKENGLWHRITVNTEYVLLDGHHRFKMCQELGIQPRIEFKNFATPLQEKQFVINSNLKRRHLNDFQKAELGYILEGLYSESAKQRQLSSLRPGNKIPSVSNDNNGEKGRTSAVIANQIGISASIYNRAKKIILEGPESTKQKLRSGKSTISKEYQRLQKAIAIQELTSTISCSNVSSSEIYNLMLGDMRELGKNIPDESIDLIFTDPPYADLSLYEDLLKLSCRILKQGGSLVMYAPNQLDKIFRMLEGFDLKYADIIAIHQNGDTAKLWKYGVWADCKFLIWCFKGDKPTKFHDLSNFIQSEKADKHNHKWEQSTIEATDMIKPLTLEGMTVLDPFMGSGTTGIAALKLNRKFIGIEIDPVHYSNAQTRLSSITGRLEDLKEK